MVSAIAFSIALFCLLEAIPFKKDFFNPARIYIFTQSLTFGIAYLKLHPAMTDFHILTWLVFLGGGLSFVFGCYAMKLSFKDDIPNTTLQHKFDAFKNYRWNFHCFFAFILFLLYFLPAKLLWDFAEGFPLFSDKIGDVMSDRITAILGRFVYPLPLAPLVILLFGTASFSSVNPHKNLRNFSKLIIILQFALVLLFNPARNTLFISMILLVILWNYLKKQIPSSLLILGMIITLGLFVSIGYVRNQYDSGSTKQQSVANKIILLPYNYVANNYWNLDFALNPSTTNWQHPTTYGIGHFFSQMPLVGSALQEAFNWDNSYNGNARKTNYNTISYLWEIYKDFGGIGIAVVPFFWGFLITWLYMRLKIKLQMRMLLLYSLAITMVSLWWFSIWYKISPIYGFFILAILGITEFCQNKKSIKHEQ